MLKSRLHPTGCKAVLHDIEMYQLNIDIEGYQQVSPTNGR